MEQILIIFLLSFTISVLGASTVFLGYMIGWRKGFNASEKIHTLHKSSQGKWLCPIHAPLTKDEKEDKTNVSRDLAGAT